MHPFLYTTMKSVEHDAYIDRLLQNAPQCTQCAYDASAAMQNRRAFISQERLRQELNDPDTGVVRRALCNALLWCSGSKSPLKHYGHECTADNGTLNA